MRHKWDKKSKMILVGFRDNIERYRLYDPTEKITKKLDVMVNENE